MSCLCPALYYCAATERYLYYPRNTTEYCSERSSLQLAVPAFTFSCEGALSHCVRCTFNESAVARSRRGGNATMPLGVGVCGVSPWRVAVLTVSVVFGLLVLGFAALVVFCNVRARVHRRAAQAQQRRLAEQNQPRAPTAYVEAEAIAGRSHLFLTLPPKR